MNAEDQTAARQAFWEKAALASLLSRTPPEEASEDADALLEEWELRWGKEQTA